MSYASITVAPELTMADYQRVGQHLGSDPADGLISEAAGCNDAGLHVVTVWESKTQQARFIADRLLPAFQSAGVQPGPMTVTDIEIGTLYLRDGSAVEG